MGTPATNKNPTTTATVHQPPATCGKIDKPAPSPLAPADPKEDASRPQKDRVGSTAFLHQTDQKKVGAKPTTSGSQF